MIATRCLIRIMRLVYALRTTEKGRESLEEIMNFDERILEMRKQGEALRQAFGYELSLIHI